VTDQSGELAVTTNRTLKRFRLSENFLTRECGRAMPKAARSNEMFFSTWQRHRRPLQAQQPDPEGGLPATAQDAGHPALHPAHEDALDVAAMQFDTNIRILHKTIEETRQMITETNEAEKMVVEFGERALEMDAQSERKRLLADGHDREAAGIEAQIDQRNRKTIEKQAADREHNRNSALRTFEPSRRGSTGSRASRYSS
jgi:hypothetical protein